MTKPANSPVVLIIRDGWGANPVAEHDSFNAIKIAGQRGLTPVSDRLSREYPTTLVKTSGEDVGLPDGTMGNSEVGHQNIGAGRIVDQESVAITKACRAGLEKNDVIANGIKAAMARNGRVHVMGIASDAGVHGQLDHLFAVLKACKALGVKSEDVFVHLFTDGRDTGPFTGLGYVKVVDAACKEIGTGRVVSLCGRYFALDRDNRWERVSKAYALLTGHRLEMHWPDTSVNGIGTGTATGTLLSTGNAIDSAAASQPPLAKAPVFKSAEDAMQDYYFQPTAYADDPSAKSLVGDEFVLPRVIATDPQDASTSRIRSGDAVVFFNYRGDRPREISAAFVFDDAKWSQVKPSPDSGKNGFDRGVKLDLIYITMTAYWEELAPYVQVAYPKPPKMSNIGGEFLSKLGLRQFRCAETEKYPHVTFFFNDYRDDPFPGESRENPQSPKVATYDLKPEMSAHLIKEAVLRRLQAADCEDVLIVNFANGDMVGHTGVVEATVTACATVDACVGEIVPVVLAKGGSLIITADHGNAELMFDPATGSPHTAHTTFDVPLIVVGEKFKGRTLRGDSNPQGWFDPLVREQRPRLADVIPTVIDMLGLTKPQEMTGVSILK